MAQRARAAARSPMAAIAARVMRLARERASKASVLAELMEPYVGRKYGDDSVSTWVTGTNVPPSDALLAAARATQISLDQFLGGELETIGSGADSVAADQADVVVWQELVELPDRIAGLEKSLGEIEAKLGNLTDVATALTDIRAELRRQGALLVTYGHALQREKILDESELMGEPSDAADERLTGTDS